MKRQSKTVNRTFSIAVDVSQELHAFVKQREMSRFVSDAIRKELEAKKDLLRNEYRMASEDDGQSEVLKDWKGTVSDGNEEW